MPAENLRNQLRRGVALSGIARYLDIAIQLGISAVLARLLTPAEFGVIAVITVLISFFRLLSEAGLGTAVVQYGDLTERDLSTLFTWSFVIGAVMAGAFALAAPLIARFYENDAYLSIGRFLSISLFLQTLSVVPRAVLRQRRAFGIHGGVLVVSQAIGGIVAIIAALKGAGYYALIIKAVVSIALSFLLWTIASRIRIVPRFGTAPLIRVLRYSTFQLSANVLVYFARNLDKLLVGYYFGEEPLGYYEKSYRLMLLPIEALSYVVGPVFHPVLAAMKDDQKRMISSFTEVTAFLALVGFPLSVFLCFAASDLILVVFGPQWGPSVPVFQILALSVGFQLASSASGPTLQASGRTDLLLYTGILSTVLSAGAVAIGVISGEIRILAISVSVVTAINLFQTLFFVARLALKGKTTPVFKALLPSFGVAAATAALVGPIAWLMRDTELHLVRGIAKGAAAAAGMAVGITILRQWPLVRRALRK